MNTDNIDYKVTVFAKDYNIQVDIIDIDNIDFYEFSSLNVYWSQHHGYYEIKSNRNNYKEVLKFLRVENLKKFEKDLKVFNEVSTYVFTWKY